VGSCFYQASQLFKDTHPNEELSVFIEDGHRHGRGAVDLMLYAKQVMSTVSRPSDPPFDLGLIGDREVVRVRNFAPEDRSFMRIGSVGSGSKNSMRPLQAADILAYCTLNQSGGFSKSTIEAMRQSVPILSTTISREDIRAAIDGINNDEQRRSETRRMIHELSRTLGLFGVKVKNVSDGVQIDVSGARDIKSLEIQLPIEGAPRVEMEFGTSTKDDTITKL
jgi:hypothetical protein